MFLRLGKHVLDPTRIKRMYVIEDDDDEVLVEVATTDSTLFSVVTTGDELSQSIATANTLECRDREPRSPDPA